MNLAVCVLAAGRGTRAGAAKALLRDGDTTFLARILGAMAAAGVSERYVVARSRDAEILAACAAAGAIILVNPEPERGMLSSLHVGLAEIARREAAREALPADALFVAPVDCPRVRPETIAVLAAAFERTDAPIVVPAHAGRRGHPTLFARRLFGELLDAPLDVGARAVVRAHAADRVECAVADLAILDDFDHGAP